MRPDDLNPFRIPEVTTPNPTGDVLKALSGFHFLPETPTEEQREHCRGSGLYDIGDCRLMWVNEGDFFEATMPRTPPPSLDALKAMVDEEISALEFLRDMKDLTAAGEGELAAFHRVRALLTRLSVSIQQRDDM